MDRIFREEIPGVFSCRLFTRDATRQLRDKLEQIATSGIPRRRPNGMNRFGSILDGGVDGGVSGFDVFLDGLIDRWVRPLSESLFPASIGVGDTEDRFVFTVQYEHHTDGDNKSDTKLEEHRDASVVTMNLNLNDDSFKGSALEFIDESGNRKIVHFRPGEVLFHLGSYRHAALPITGGRRENMIIWLFGAHGDVRVAPYEDHEQLTTECRWGGRRKLSFHNMFEDTEL
jgi:hypothetical protein